MSLVLVLTIGEAVSSRLAWIGFYAGFRALPGGMPVSRFCGLHCVKSPCGLY